MSDIDKVLFAAINSQYIHSNTAVYYMREMLMAGGLSAEVKSFSINDDKHDILRKIINCRPKVVCFSCYIWNISLIYELCKDIQKIDQSIKIILGGPEVSYEPEEALDKSGADLIIRGEGETVIAEAVRNILAGELPKHTGCCYKSNDEIINTGFAITDDLETIPSPFTEFMMEKEKGRLIYYEASRGCPFNCIYCLSSATTGVRYFPLDRVFSDINTICRYKTAVVKFTDRSFNINETRTLEILEFIKNLDTDACFHLEIFPSKLNEKILTALEGMPSGRIQLEAGIQSVNIETLRASGRIQDPEQALNNMKRMASVRNMHIHLDLIAGLPKESMKSFKNSFDETINTQPHMLQVGFLKLLKGTAARKMKNYIYESAPPYEVLSTPWMSFFELSEIKLVSQCVDMFYNTGRFGSYLLHMHNKFHRAYEFYKKLIEYLKNSGVSLRGISRDNKYRTLAGFANNDNIAIEHLRYDFMSSYRAKEIPDFLGGNPVGREDVFNFLSDESNRVRYLPEYVNASPKKLYKMCNIGIFNFGTGGEKYLFKYDRRDSVTGLFDVIPIQI